MLEHLLGRNPEHMGESRLTDLKRGRVLVAFNRNHSLARDKDEVSKPPVVSCRPPAAELSYGIAKAGAHAAILYTSKFADNAHRARKNQQVEEDANQKIG